MVFLKLQFSYSLSNGTKIMASKGREIHCGRKGTMDGYGMGCIPGWEVVAGPLRRARGEGGRGKGP